MIMKLKGLSVVELDKVYAAGRGPKATELLDDSDSHFDYPVEWRVDILTGPIPSLGGWPFRHRKWFWQFSSGNVAGCNSFFKNMRWGWFKLDDRRAALDVDYDQPENGKLTRNISDLVRTTDDPNVMLGQFYYETDSRAFGPYYFSLTRIEK